MISPKFPMISYSYESTDDQWLMVHDSWLNGSWPMAQSPGLTGPPIQATGPPRLGAGVAVGMLRGLKNLTRKSHESAEKKLD